MRHQFNSESSKSYWKPFANNWKVCSSLKLLVHAPVVLGGFPEAADSAFVSQLHLQGLSEIRLEVLVLSLSSSGLVIRHEFLYNVRPDSGVSIWSLFRTSEEWYHFDKSDTVSDIFVDHVRGDLVAVPAVHPQRVDTLDQIVLHLCPRQTAALSLSVRDLPHLSVCRRTDGDVGQCARGRVTYSDVAQLAGNWTRRFSSLQINHFLCLIPFGLWRLSIISEETW